MVEAEIQPRLDIRSILPAARTVVKARSCFFLAITTIGLLAISMTAHPPYAGGTLIATPQTATLPYANPTSNAALNLSYAGVNASRGFQESNWTLTSTTAQTIINSSDALGETVSAVWRLNQTMLTQAQIIKYDFEFSTQVLNPASSGPRINATIALVSSDYQGWYAQSRTPVYSNNTETVGVRNIVGSYLNGSIQRSLIFNAQQVTDVRASTSEENVAVLFQREFPGFAAGDGVLHNYTIEIDRQSNQTIWIADDSLIATFKLSFVPSNLVFSASAAGAGDLAVAKVKDPVQAAIPVLLTVNGTNFGTSPGSSSATPPTTESSDQISSLQHQIDHLNSQLGNLTTQNAQLQAKGSQWFTQWWAGLIWSFLGAAVGGSFLVGGSKLRTNRKESSGALPRADSGCPQCGGKMPLDAAFCGECGSLLKETKPTCPECGEPMPTASIYCGDCGTQIAAQEQRAQNAAVPSKEDGTGGNKGSWR
jgi:predicted nucleic acid-binding Zn ribbon protein